MTAAGGVQWDASPETFLLLNALFDKFGCIFLEFAQLTVTAIKRWGFSIPMCWATILFQTLCRFQLFIVVYDKKHLHKKT